MEDYMWTYILEERFPILLTDEEFRVRNQTATLIKAIVLTDRSGKGVTNFDKIKEQLLQNIQQTFERDTSGDASGALTRQVYVRPLIKPDSTSGKTMHDSEGWKSLETSMRNLQHLIEAIGTHLYAFDLS